MQDKELYKNVLGIKSPWMVADVILEISKKTVTIKVEYDKTQPCGCPDCQKDATRYDHSKRRWRHLDTCQMKTIIECDVPRVNCKEHGVKQMSVPWAESKSHFTAMFEALVINWLKEASISAVADLCCLTRDSVAGIQERAVERGLKRRKAKPLKSISIDETSYRGSAEKAWLRLLSWIRRCRLAPVKKVGRMVKKYLWGILNAIIAQITNASAEAKNARIQRIKNMACGFRNPQRFRMAILLLFHLGGLDLMPERLGNYA